MEVRKPRFLDGVRTLVALGVILPGALVGVWTAIRSGDRRRAFNRAVALWGAWGTRAAGIDLRIQGAEFLDVRPAVFVINHQSGVDPILVCALLKRDFVGVAKAELRRNPVLGPAFALAGTIFLDRGDGPSAHKRLETGLKILAQGVAVAIAPEGTRSPGARLGDFKTGGFRLAAAAGVPVIPVVIRDAGKILPPGGFIMRAGKVRVSVEPPISTVDWDLESIHDHSASVQAVFESALARAR
jgi:putative phosphoserine phosphatase / 1-acylglycerol-3-phosphate O-acyltransferase